MQSLSMAAKVNRQPESVRSDHPLRVVVVDDSTDFRVAICELLLMLFDVEIVGVGKNGFDAIELTADQRPDLLIMDVNMPGLDGITATSVIAEHFPSTTILMMSADDAPETREACLRSGAHVFSTKRDVSKQIAHLNTLLF